MQTIILETKIAAPIERCFLLSLSIDLHKASSIKTKEQAIAGVTRGLIGKGQTVTWRAKHFGVWLKHTAVISQYSRHHHFRDEMTQGAFKSFTHDHFFTTNHDGTTQMRDELTFAAPFGPIGLLFEKWLLRHHLLKFLKERNAVIQRIAEAPEAVWQSFLRVD